MKSAWSTWHIPGWLELHRQTASPLTSQVFWHGNLSSCSSDSPFSKHLSYPKCSAHSRYGHRYSQVPCNLGLGETTLFSLLEPCRDKLSRLQHDTKLHDLPHYSQLTSHSAKSYPWSARQSWSLYCVSRSGQVRGVPWESFLITKGKRKIQRFRTNNLE